jgi:hypothetical protein
LTARITDVAHSRTFALTAAGGIAVATVLAVVGHVDPNGSLDPWTLTVSDFAVSDRGGAIDIAMGLIAATTVLVVAGLRRAGIAIGARITALLTTWTSGVLISAIVPTDEPGLPLSTAGAVHRYASIAAFLALPVAGWLLAGRLPNAAAARWIRRLAVTSLACALGMACSAFLADRLLIGLVERLLIAAEIGLLAIIVMVLARTSRTVRPVTSEQSTADRFRTAESTSDTERRTLRWQAQRARRHGDRYAYGQGRRAARRQLHATRRIAGTAVRH